METAEVVVSRSLAYERQAASAARRYHEAARKVFSFAERRRELARFAESFYRTRLNVPVTSEGRAAFEAISDPDTVLLEMAHDGQLPHLGIVRMALKAHDIARADRQAVTLYPIGNHYTSMMRRDNLRFGMPLKGAAPDRVKNPPKLLIPKSKGHTPFRWLPPPTARDLEDLRYHVAEYLTDNIAYERKLGVWVARDAKERAGQNLQDVFERLIRAAQEVSSLGDWLIRIQHDIFRDMIGSEADRIVFLPMAELSDLARDELVRIGAMEDSVAAIKAEVSAEQLARGEIPYQREPQASAFWIHCPSCHRRSRDGWRPGKRLEFACPFCGQRNILEGESAWESVMPDIVAWEAAFLQFGIDEWVVGSHAPYHPVIERVYREVFDLEMAPKYFLTSVPTFRGIGDPPDGYGKTRLLRALLEMEPAAIGAALRLPWNQDPRLRSELLPEDEVA